MEEKIYKVARIEGEYAILLDGSSNCREEDGIFIALALLPCGIDTGSKLRYKNFSYELLEDQ